MAAAALVKPHALALPVRLQFLFVDTAHSALEREATATSQSVLQPRAARQMTALDIHPACLLSVRSCLGGGRAAERKTAVTEVEERAQLGRGGCVSPVQLPPLGPRAKDAEKALVCLTWSE